MSENGANGVSRFAVELGVAALTGAFGAAVCYGSLDIGAGWTEFGPEAGYFPFYVGLLILLGSVANAIHAFVKHRGSGEIFIDGDRAKVVASFLLPLVVFAGVSAWLGLYVGTALYIAGTMLFQGRYKWWIALPSGIAVSLFFFIVFEFGFKVPLLKGPIEAWFGIY
ncbi:tripartite tricarboxylate transporter TctB family protein [Ensifer adhaerens]|uniref:tripartite tricarboxylate transporter TctB family protein n=1 Tax=Ensifer adhaerens TaxID=106592 RepID=UPI00384AC511